MAVAEALQICTPAEGGSTRSETASPTCVTHSNYMCDAVQLASQAAQVQANVSCSQHRIACVTDSAKSR